MKFLIILKHKLRNIELVEPILNQGQNNFGICIFSKVFQIWVAAWFSFDKLSRTLNYVEDL